MADPVHHVEELAHEAERGRSPRTPLIVLSGVSMVVFAIVIVILGLAFLAYFLG
jgi:hypothetical protein